jgi:hypothetical protein
MMYGSTELLGITRRYFDWLERDYSMKLAQLGRAEISMANSRVTLWLLFSLDLPRLMYVELDQRGEAEGYDLWHFFVMKRRMKISACFRQAPPTATIAERNEVMLEALACGLKSAGLDILQGDRSWKAYYPGPPEKCG